jgi:hypothetical protein
MDFLPELQLLFRLATCQGQGYGGYTADQGEEEIL